MHLPYKKALSFALLLHVHAATYPQEPNEDSISLLQTAVAHSRAWQGSEGPHGKTKGWDPAAVQLCIQNKSVPALYLLGAQKCGTSSLAADIKGTLGAFLPHNMKELHFFDPEGTTTVERCGGGKHPITREGWLDQMPPCGSRNFVADMTPSNLRLGNAPGMLKEFYGDRLKEVTFVVLLREPLARYQSAYYHGKADGWPWTAGAGTFSEKLNQDLSKAGGHKLSEDPSETGVWGSMYAPQLASWLKHTDASQFIIAFMKEYDADPEGLLQAIASRMGGAHVGNFRTTRTPERNHHAHPTLDKDLDEDTKFRYDRFMASWNNQLMKVLWNMKAHGAYLHGCPAHISDEKSLKDWVTANW